MYVSARILTTISWLAEIYSLPHKYFAQTKNSGLATKYVPNATSKAAQLKPIQTPYNYINRRRKGKNNGNKWVGEGNNRQLATH